MDDVGCENSEIARLVEAEWPKKMGGKKDGRERKG